MRYKKPVLVSRLPATPCTPEMRKSMEELAAKQGVSLADIQREAVSLFLRSTDTLCITSDTQGSGLKS